MLFTTRVDKIALSILANADNDFIHTHKSQALSEIVFLAFCAFPPTTSESWRKKLLENDKLPQHVDIATFLFRLLHTESVAEKTVAEHLHEHISLADLPTMFAREEICLPLEKSLGRQIFDVRCLAAEKEANICSGDGNKQRWAEDAINGFGGREKSLRERIHRDTSNSCDTSRQINKKTKVSRVTRRACVEWRENAVRRMKRDCIKALKFYYSKER